MREGSEFLREHMLKKHDLEPAMSDLESLINSMDDIGYSNLLGAEPSEADRVLGLEKAFAKVMRALQKARSDLEKAIEMCD